MNDEQIAKLYDQALVIESNGDYVAGELDPVKFAKLVAQHEREACAKEADKRLYDYTMLLSNPPQNGAAWSIANAIRARGQRTPEGGEA